jgi:hypothetical protein
MRVGAIVMSASPREDGAAGAAAEGATVAARWHHVQSIDWIRDITMVYG